MSKIEESIIGLVIIVLGLVFLFNYNSKTKKVSYD